MIVPLVKMDRRSFLGGTGALVMGLFLAPRVAGAARLKDMKHGDATPALFIAIEKDGQVVLTCHRSEMGQHVWTAMAQLLADELEAPWERVRVVQAPGHPKYGDQNTDGSRSVRYNFTRLRTAGAAMRHMLEHAAAKRWQVKPAECRGEQGEVTHEPTGRKLAYGALAEAAAELPVPRVEDVALKPRERWRYISHSVPSKIVPYIVKGQGTFGIDFQMAGMLYAVIEHPPQVLGSIRSVDDAETLRTPGVLKTVRLPVPKPPVHFQPLGGVAVVARDTWSAIRGREALKVTWNPGPNADYDTEAFAETLMAAAHEPGRVRRKRGDVHAALKSAPKRVTADYYVPHLAHSPMAPPAVTARWKDGEVELWGGIQAPQAARNTVARICGLPVEKVRINVTWLGGAFGRKSKPDFFAEAALIAREMDGAPVKVTWTREDDIQHSYYHTISAQHLEAGLDEQGKCVAWLHRTVFPPIESTFKGDADEPAWGDLMQGASDTPFAIPNLQLETGRARAHVRIGWLRSVANMYHAFAVQSFVGELAHAAGRDPKDYLLELIGPPRLVDPNEEGAKYDNYGSPLKEYPIDTGRLANVVRVVAEMARWGRELPKGHGLGIAAHRSFTTHAATVVEVAVDDDRHLTIVGAWSVLDAGTVVNPRHVEAQIEGGTLFGLSNALFGEITVHDGAVVQSNFPEWRVMRMNEAPRHLEVRIIESDGPPGGVGEPPTPPAAPALVNAIFAATGEGFRRLPIIGANRHNRLPEKGA